MALINDQKELSNDKGKSSISYILKHRIHTVTGVSRQVTSNIHFDDSSKTIASVTVTVPVKSFDSGNKTRDKDMLKVTEVVTYPMIKFTSSSIAGNNNKLTVKGQLQFHGIKQNITFQAKQQLTNDQVSVEGVFPISLESFKIKRPSILGMAVKDVVTIEFHMVYPTAKTDP